MRKFDEIDFLEAVLEIKRSKVSQESSHSSLRDVEVFLGFSAYIIREMKVFPFTKL